jgi:hypothetical protein
LFATSAAISLSHGDRRKKKGFLPRNADPRQFQLEATLNRSFVTILPDEVIASSIFKGEKNMSNHFTGLSLGPPLGDQRLDLCDLYALQAPTDRSRTVIILNANPNADALHPDAIYRLNIDNDGDCLTDIAFSYVFSKPQNGKQTVNVFLAKGEESRSVEAVGKKIIADGEVSFGAKPNIVKSAPTRSSPAVGATRSFSTSTESRICSISGESGTSPSRTSAPNLRGPAWIRIRKPMCSRR